MIRHIVIVSLEKGFLDNEKLVRYSETFKMMEEEYDYIISAEIKENAVNRKGNGDFAMIVDVENIEGFEEYLLNPLHKLVSNEIKEYVVSKTKIDYEI